MVSGSGHGKVMRDEPAELNQGASATRGRQAQASPLRKVYLTAAAVLAALVPIILFSGLWVRSELNEGRRDVEEFLISRAAALSQRVDSEVQQELTVLQTLATAPSLDESDLTDFHAQATRMMSAMPEWAFIALARPDGAQVANTLRPLGEQLPSLDAETSRRVAETRRPAVYSRLGFGDEAIYPGLVILLCVPVIRAGAADRILVAGMKTEHMQQLLRQSHDQRLVSMIVDERGYVLARSQAPERSIGKEVDGALRQQTAGRSSGVFAATTQDNENVLTTYQRSPLTGWLSVVTTGRREFDALSARSTWATIATGLLSLTLAAILGVFIFYNIVERRISKERLEASRALGELDTRLLATTQEALTEQRKAASEREVLLREIYHRVKNNLQIIQSLLRLGSRDLSEEQREPFENAVRRIGAMARVHTLLYNSPDLASIDFKDYLEGLVREIADAFGADERGIETTLAAQSMRVPLDTAVPLAFIATELLTNAYKHAFPDDRTGKIAIVARRKDGHGLLEITDTGVGLPESTVPRRPLGLTIVAKLVQQIGGTLEEPGPGQSRFRVTYPLDGVAPSLPVGVEKAPTMAPA
jgi:two-component sensor histidine kinase